jgi:mRNA interferase MazF
VDLVKRPHRDEVWLVSLDPVIGAKVQKTRPCVVISPDDLNGELLSVIVAPMTSTVRPFPFRVNLTFQGTAGQVALDQSRAVSVMRMVRKLGRVSPKAAQEISAILAELFER